MRAGRRHNRKAQAIVEYLMLFLAIVGVIVFALLSPAGPFRNALGGLYNRTANSIRRIPIP